MNKTMNNCGANHKSDIQVHGITVHLVFAEEQNEELPALVREMLKSSFAKQRPA